MGLVGLGCWGHKNLCDASYLEMAVQDERVMMSVLLLSDLIHQYCPFCSDSML